MNKAAEILKDLVSFPVLGGQSNLSIIKYIQDYLDGFDIEWHLVEKPEEKKTSLHCRIGPSADGGVVLSGHTDVVPVVGQEWTSNPFELTDKGDGKLYGRGSCDMKGFIACCLACVPEMVKADLKRPIYFAFSYDEEVGCLAGPALAKAIMDFYDETPKYAIIGEPSLMQPIIGQKGITVFETTVYGSAGHSSRIKQEVSAIHEAARLIMWLENKMEELIEAGHTDDRFIPNHSSLHIGTIHGGIAPNVIADQCVFHWDCRTIPRDDAWNIYNEFEAYCRQREEIMRERFAGAKIETSMHHPPVVPLNTPEEYEIVDLVKRLSGNDDLQTVSYAAEAGQFAEAGFQAIICGPGSIAQAHRADEFIAKEELDRGVLFLQKLIVELSA
ncbi:MAG: acetylornithine deacetylase [Saprospiraceae bacterium]|nr:acetylornithine deacetylase [Saprospiraceae bacterium]